MPAFDERKTMTNNILSSVESDYVERLSSLSDIELMNEQDENFVALVSLLCQLNSIRQDRGISEKIIDRFENSVSSIEGKIKVVRTEIEDRDLTIERLARNHTTAYLFA